MPILSEIDSNTDQSVLNRQTSKREKMNRSTSLVMSSDDDDDDDDDESLSDDYYEDDDDDEDYDTAIGVKSRPRQQSQLHFDDGDDDDENYLSPSELDLDESNKENRNEKRKNHPDSVVKSKKSDGYSHKGSSKIGAKKTPNPKARKRRRSSARFLRLSGRFNDDEDGDEIGDGDGAYNGGIELIGGETVEEKQAKLGEMYRHAIRLNAENKINVGNSWGLNLIDNIDKFLGDDNDNDDCAIVKDCQMMENSSRNKEKQNGGEKGLKRVNFTKASCTLDASVKIYSYRVDDVHLTSYKVLANLNRTDSGKEKNQNLFNDGGVAAGDSEQSKRRSLVDDSRKTGRHTTVETIESNLSNINVSKLDAAYDIDPIFHKMSQTFDEGGAKGLLLVNLGVASDGCRIILDSKEDKIVNTDSENSSTETEDDDEKVYDNTEDPEEKDNKHHTNNIYEEGEIDISDIRSKLQELLLCSPLHSIQLVPQLEELRASYAALEGEGFTDQRSIKQLNSKRYANDEEEEKAAEESIQREAFERSRASGLHCTSILAPNMSIFTTASNKTSHEYAPDDYGGDFDDFDDHEGPSFDNFIPTDDNAEKYASTSFVENEMKQDEVPSYSSSVKENSSNITFLDAICQGEALNTGSQYNYFDTRSIDEIVAGNQWAGAAHWKKNQRSRTKAKKLSTKEDEPKRNDQKRKRKKETKDLEAKSTINLKNCFKCLDPLLKKNRRTKGKMSDTDASQFTKAMKQKYSKERNILPQDAEINMKQFSMLFMRPDAVISDFVSGPPAPRKSVGFHETEITAFDDGVDDSYDEGPGFEMVSKDNDGNFAEMDDYVVKDLDDVRKVDKVRVKHATVAKKVDVRRLKKDLWKEVDSRTAPKLPVNIDQNDGDDYEISNLDDSSPGEILFKDVVNDLGENETQQDVSLAFYFICILHLANEKCLKLENGDNGLNDFVITKDREQ